MTDNWQAFTADLLDQQCPGSGIPGGVFNLPGLPQGVTCQVCGHDFKDDGSGILRPHRAQVDG